MKLSSILALSALLAASSASAATINVPADQSSIQAAIDAANDGDTVLVAPGTYYEQLDFKGKAITVTSSGGAAVTILDGSNGSPIVTFDTGEGSASVLQGFTLMHASNTGSGGSAAVSINPGTVVLNPASPTIEDNVFIANIDATDEGGGSAIYAAFSAAIIVHNYFVGNSGGQNGGLVVYLLGGNNVVADNVFANNPSVVACYEVTVDSAPQVYNNTMVGNGAGLSVNMFGANPSGISFSNNLIAFNETGVRMSKDSDVPPLLSNNLVYGNSFADYAGIPSQTGIDGNISSDPDLKDWAHGDVHLLYGSPAIDAGDSSVSQFSDTDFYGNPRVAIGYPGDSSVVDIGAAEYTPPTVAAVGASLLTVPDVTQIATLHSSGADSTEPLTFVITSLSAHGTLTLTGATTGTIRYVPAKGYAGSDSFGFEVTDPYGASPTATETVQVQDIAPTFPAFAISLHAIPGETVKGSLKAHTAYAGQTLSYAVVSEPAHGVLTLSATTGAYTYTAARGFKGRDQFTFHVTDQWGTPSKTQTVNILVL